MAKISRLVKTLFWLVLGVAVAVALGWWLARLLREEEEAEEAVWVPPTRPADINIPLPEQPVDAPPDLAAFEAALDDIEDREEPAVSEVADFTRIDGIGPKYAQGLVACGVRTFGDLSNQDPETLAEVLRAQGLRIIGDRIQQDDWIGQARQILAEG